MSKTKTQLTAPKVGMHIYCQQPELSEAVTLDDGLYHHADAKIIKVTKHDIGVQFSDKADIPARELSFPAKNLENFWEVFKLKQAQGFCYDPTSIWVAHDGDGGVYSYDSEEECRDYAAKNDEEDTVHDLGRSEREQAAPEMYVLLKRVHERLMDFQTGKSTTLKDLMGLMPRIGDAVAAAEKDENLLKVVEFLKIPAAY